MISVIMPVYNAERYVAEAVQSILDQTFRDFEFIIVNDGSTDGSLAILERFAKSDPRIKLISRPNTGLVFALNEMLELARGEFIARMDADDVAIPDRFAQQLRYLAQHPDVVAVGCRVYLIDPKGRRLCEAFGDPDHEAIDRAFMRGEGGAIAHPTAMIRTTALRAIGGYRPEFFPAEDVDLFLRLAEHGRLGNLPTVLLNYRVHMASIGHQKRALQRERTEHAVQEARRRRRMVPDTRLSVSSTDSEPESDDHLVRWAWWALRGQNFSTARHYAFRAALHRPVSLSRIKLLYCAVRGR